VVGKKKNQVQVAIDLWRSMMTKGTKPVDHKLREIVALLNDQVGGTFDPRKLLNLRRVMLTGAGLGEAELL